MKRMTDTELSARITQFMQRKSMDYPELLSKYAKSRGNEADVVLHAQGHTHTSDVRLVP